MGCAHIAAYIHTYTISSSQADVHVLHLGSLQYLMMSDGYNRVSPSMHSLVSQAA